MSWPDFRRPDGELPGPPPTWFLPWRSHGKRSHMHPACVCVCLEELRRSERLSRQTSARLLTSWIADHNSGKHKAISKGPPTCLQHVRARALGESGTWPRTSSSADLHLEHDVTECSGTGHFSKGSRREQLHPEPKHLKGRHNTGLLDGGPAHVFLPCRRKFKRQLTLKRKRLGHTIILNPTRLYAEAR